MQMDVKTSKKHKTMIKFTSEQQNEIIRLYVHEKQIPRQIAKLFGCSDTCIRRVLKANNISLRSISESQKVRFNNPKERKRYSKIMKNNTIRLGKTHSEIAKKKMSEAQTKRYQNETERAKARDAWSPKNKNVNGRGKQGIYKDFIYQSNYELNYMKFLEQNNILFQKADTKEHRILYFFKNQKHYYYPDFYLPETDVIVEIKASFAVKNPVNKAKFKAAKKILGDKFIVITEKDIKELRT